MRIRMRKLLSLLLVLVMVLSVMPAQAFAKENNASGGADVTGSLEDSVIPSEEKDLTGDSMSAEPLQNDNLAGEPEAYGVPQMEEAAPITTTELRSYSFTSVPENGFTIPANGNYTIHWATNFTPVKQVIKKMQYAASIVDPNDPPVLIWDSTLVELSAGVSSYPIAWDPDFIDDASSTSGCCYELWAYYSDSEYIVSRFVGISEKAVFIQEPTGGFTIPANGTHRINWSTNFAQTGFKIVYSVYTMSITDGSPFLWDQKTVAESSGSQTWYDLLWDAGFSGHNAGIYTLYVYYSNGTSGHSIQIDFPGGSEARAFTQTPPARFDIPVNGSYTINWDTSFQCDKYVLQVDTYIVPFDGGSPIHSGETETIAVMPGTQKSYTFGWIHPDQAGQGQFIYDEYTLLAYDSYDSTVVERVYFRINFERPAFTRWPSSAMMTKISPANLNWETNFDIQRVTLYSVRYYYGSYEYIFIRSLPAGTTSCEINYHDIQDAYLQGYNKLAIRAFYGSGDSEYVQHDLEISIQNTEGYCGIDNGSYQIWSFDESTGTLTISGTGQMADFTAADVPWAFYRSSIQTVNIEEGVTGVGDYAFYNCPNLTTVNLPYSLTGIGDYAFDACPALADANINMSQQVFNTTVTWDKTKNTGLRDAVKHFTSIAAGQAGPNLTWTLDNSGVLLFSGSGAMYNWSISEPAPWYSYRSIITTLRLVNVTTVGDCAFRGCSKLTAVTFPSDLTYLGVRAFGSCSGLTTVYWAAPSYMNLTEIREACFSGTALQSFTVPKKCAVIGQGAFSGCDALTSVSFLEGSALTTVGKRAFYSCDNLKNISLPEGVTSLGDEAFYNCKSLTSFPLPSGLTSLGESCFSGCSGVTGVVTIPAGITEIPNRCFLNCSGFYKLELTPGLSSVGPYAFSGCSKLTKVDYDGFRAQWEQVAVSNNNAPLTGAQFSWLYRSGTLYGGLTWQLYGGPGKLVIWGSGAMPNWTGASSQPWGQYRDYIELIDVHSGVTQIGAYAFSGSAVETVNLPTSVSSIGSSAFQNCSSLADVWYDGSQVERQTKLSISGSNGSLEAATWHYTAIGGNVYGDDGGTDLSWSLDDSGTLRIYWDEDSMDQGDMEIPDYQDYTRTPWYEYGDGNGVLFPMIKAVQVDELVTRIGDNAFRGMTELRDVQIASTVTSIGYGAFRDCSKLTSITIPDTVETLESSVFWGCTNLYDIHLPAGLTEIPYGAFYDCEDLHTVYIPGTLESIGQVAFKNCGELTDVYFNGSSAQWMNIEKGSGNEALDSATIHFIPPEIAVDAVNFPDPAFRAYVAEYIDADGSGYLTDAERLSVTNIGCESLGIADLTGIAYFPNLQVLNCSGNTIASLDLSGNVKLTNLNCSGNTLSSGLDLSSHTLLTGLNCSGCGLTVLDVSANTALTYLQCSINSLTTLNVDVNTAIEILYCYRNQLTVLDLSNNASLQYLDCSSNAITSLDLSSNPALVMVECHNNALTSLILGWQSNLIRLFCEDNRIERLDILNSEHLMNCVMNNDAVHEVNGNYHNYYFDNNNEYLRVDISTVLVTDHDGIPVDEAHFPDAAFRIYVEAACDTNHNGWLSPNEQSAVESIDCCEMGIKTLIGIRYFPNLGELYCYENDIVGLDLSSNVNLWYLECQGNAHLGVLDLSSNTELTYLDCGFCGLTSLTLGNKPVLAELMCNSNSLTALDLSSMSSLWYLDCMENELTSLDLSDNAALSYVDCSKNALTSLTLGELPLLKELWAAENEFIVLDISHCSKLKTTVLEGTCSTEDTQYYSGGPDNGYLEVDLDVQLITSYVLLGIDASSTGIVYNESLGRYWLADNTRTLTWKDDNEPGFTALSSWSIGFFDSESHNVTTEPVPGEVYLVHYGVSTSTQGQGLVDFSELTKNDCTLEIPGYTCTCYLVSTRQINGYDTVDMYFQVTKDVPEGIPIDEAHFPDTNFRAYVAENFDDDGDGYLTIAERAAVTEIELSSSNAASLEGIAYFGELASLELYENNSLTALDLSGNTALRGVYVYNNDVLTTLDLTGLTLLKDLEAEYNSLASLDLSTNTALESLDCGGNCLTALDLSHCPELQSLSCYENSLTTLDVSMLTKLEYLSCSDNMLTELDVPANSLLTQLDCSRNLLTEIDLSVVPMLRGLWIIRNGLTALDVSMLPELRVLDCYDMPLQTLTLGNLENLSHLACHGMPESLTLDISGCPLILDAYQNGTKTTVNNPGGLTFDQYKNGYNVLQIDPDQVVIESAAAEPSNITATSVDFSSKLYIHVYLEVSEEIAADDNAYINVTFNGKTTKHLVSNLPIERGYALVRQEVFAFEMRDEMELQIFNGNDEVQPLTYKQTTDVTNGFTYTVLEYLKNRQANSTKPTMVELARVTELYGIAAQVYFNYKTEQLTEEDIAKLQTEANGTSIPNNYEEIVTGELPDGVTRRPRSVLFESDNTLRQYFFFEDAELGKYTIRINGEVVTPTKLEAGRYYVEKKDITSVKLKAAYSFSISDGTDTFTVEWSALTYAYSRQENSDDINMIRLVKMLYLYSQAATAYFGQ